MLQNKKNSIWLTIQFVSSLIFSLITLKMNLIHFGEHIFGIWILMISFWGISTVVDLGFGTAIVKYIAGAKANDDNQEINKIASTGFVIFFTLGILLLVTGILIALAIYYSNTSIIPKQYLAEFKVVFLFLGFSFYFQYLVVFFRSLFEGFNNFVITSKLTLVYNLLILSSVIIVFVFKLSLWMLALFYIISSIMLLLLYYITLKRIFKSVQVDPGKFSFRYARSMLSFSFSVQIATFLGSAIDPVIKYIIGNYSSTNIISYYEVARRFALAISGLFNNAFKTILPRTSVLTNQSDFREFILNEGINYPKFGIVYSAIFYGVFSIFIVLLIHFWFGFEQSIIIFFVLSLAEAVNNTGFMLYSFFTGIGKGLYLVIIQSSNIILVIIGLIVGFLIFGNQLGLLGYFVSVLLMNFLMVYLLSKQTEISIKQYLRKIRAEKLFLLLFFILILIISNYAYSANIYFFSTGLSLLCLFLYMRDIKHYLSLLKGLFSFLRNVELKN
jgi:O-antigen/teichoic acid export membrane protein